MLGAKVYFDPAWINIRTQGHRWSKQSIINGTRMLEAKKPNSFDMWENIHLWGPWGGREKMVKMVLLPLTFLMHLYSPHSRVDCQDIPHLCVEAIDAKPIIFPWFAIIVPVALMVQFCTMQNTLLLLLPTKSWNAKLFKVKNPFQR